MKQREVNKWARKLSMVQKAPNFEEQRKAAIDLQREMKLVVPFPGSGAGEDIYYRTSQMHTILQTETMVNAGKVAMWSCVFALFAAIAGAVGAVVACLTVLSK
jgi:hypothetical protein